MPDWSNHWYLVGGVDLVDGGEASLPEPQKTEFWDEHSSYGLMYLEDSISTPGVIHSATGRDGALASLFLLKWVLRKPDQARSTINHWDSGLNESQVLGAIVDGLAIAFTSAWETGCFAYGCGEDSKPKVTQRLSSEQQETIRVWPPIGEWRFNDFTTSWLVELGSQISEIEGSGFDAAIARVNSALTQPPNLSIHDHSRIEDHRKLYNEHS